MKLIRIGLTTNNLTSLLHESIYLENKDALYVTGFLLTNEQINNNNLGIPLFERTLPGQCMAEVKNWIFNISSSKQNAIALISPTDMRQHNAPQLFSVLLIKSKSGYLTINTHKNSGPGKEYPGYLMLMAQENQFRAILYCPLEEYVRSVLQGEVPANYQIEAIKAQAVCARTYGLYPRVDHSADFCDVCDSYQCCQCFAGGIEKKNSAYIIASNDTAGEILTYQDEMALALFSSCGGGHTENYEDCFSDWKINLFPPKPIAYLRGVSENIDSGFRRHKVSTDDLKRLWEMHEPATVDAWSKNFRWSLKLANQDLESHIHHNVDLMLNQKDIAPFVTPPPSGIFGEILLCEVTKRGVGGTAINLTIDTSKGKWQFTKELTIRNLFKNLSINLKRLASARFYLIHTHDSSGELLWLNIYGLGSGHGVGLQQVGAEGLARRGMTYKQILSHYYTKIEISKV